MWKLLRLCIRSVLVLAVVSTVALVAMAGWSAWRLEYELDVPSRHRLAVVSAADGVCSSNGERNFVPLTAIPPMVRSAFLAAEEPDFFDRPPINPFVEFARAALFNQKPRTSSISSTVVRCLMSLSTQCCKNHVEWHVGNAVLMYRVESTLSKDLIFELYLNETWFGRRAYGAGAAARAYFGKSLSDLPPDEAAYIAGLPRVSSAVGRDQERGIRRRNLVIDRMRDAGAISPSQATSAKQQPLLLREPSAPI